jgi:ribokinase
MDYIETTIETPDQSGPRVWVVGSVHMDVIALADRHPRVGETVMGSQLRLLPGGKGANQAVAARRGGAATSLVARLGEDAFAEQLWSFLRDEDIDLQHTRSLGGESTGVAVIVVAESNNSIVVVPGAGGLMDVTALDALEIGAGDVVVAQLEAPEAVTAAAIARAKAAGALSVLNPAPALPTAGHLLDDADVLVLNETELAVFSAAEDVATLADPAAALAAAAELRRHPGQVVIVTLGVAGAVCVGPEGSLHVAGRSVEVVDSTGAGDCFAGNLAAGLCAGRPLAEALEMANLAASLSVQTPGAAVSMPDAEAILAAAKGTPEARGPGVTPS